MATSNFENAEATVGGVVEIDNTSDYASSDWESDTTSITSTILEHVYENGRRYHSYKEGHYVLPNDEREQERLDLMHHIFGMMLNGELLLAPIENPHRVLDLGTGTGIWAIDFADKYPSAEVIGCDLSPIQPSWVPPNLKFEIDDFESPWQWVKKSFDLIHGRMLAGCAKDWPAVYAQAFTTLKPGGFLEMQEMMMTTYSDDDTIKGSKHELISNLIDEASTKLGRPMLIADKIKGWMIDAGFVDVEERVYFCPYAPWPRDKKLKELGRVQMVQQLDGVEPVCLALFTRVLGMSEKEAKEKINSLVEEVKARTVQAYTKVYVVHGRKPKGEN